MPTTAWKALSDRSTGDTSQQAKALVGKSLNMNLVWHKLATRSLVDNSDVGANIFFLPELIWRYVANKLHRHSLIHFSFN